MYHLIDLVSPEQENGIRILYKVKEFEFITHSINVTLKEIKEIAKEIERNYT